jgi:hypothetical protein
MSNIIAADWDLNQHCVENHNVVVSVQNAAESAVNGSWNRETLSFVKG